MEAAWDELGVPKVAHELTVYSKLLSAASGRCSTHFDMHLGPSSPFLGQVVVSGNIAEFDRGFGRSLIRTVQMLLFPPTSRSAPSYFRLTQNTRGSAFPIGFRGVPSCSALATSS